MRKLSPTRLPKAAASIRAGAIHARPGMPILGKEAARRSPARTASGLRLGTSGPAQRFFTRPSLPQRGWKASAGGFWGAPGFGHFGPLPGASVKSVLQNLLSISLCVGQSAVVGSADLRQTCKAFLWELVP